MRATCDVNSSIKPDLELVGENGVTFAHKFVIFAFLPDIQKLLCDSCLTGHDTTTIMIPTIPVEEIIEARDFLYMFGEKENFAKLFDMKKEDSKSDPSVEVLTKRRKPGPKIGTKRSENIDVNVKIPSKKMRRENVEKRKQEKISHTDEKVCLEKAINIFEKRNLKRCSITIDQSESQTNDLEINKDSFTTEELVEISEAETEGILNIVTADEEELIGEQIDVKNEIETDVKDDSDMNKRKVAAVPAQTNGSRAENSCRECWKTFSDSLSLKHHVNSEHRGIRYPCDYCEYLGTEIKAVKSHIDIDHPSLVNRYKNISVF